MGGIFNYDGKFTRALQKIADVIIVSVLWLVGCLVCLVIRVDYVIKFLPLIIVVVPGLIAYLNSTMFVKIFEPYMPKEEAEEISE